MKDNSLARFRSVAALQTVAIASPFEVQFSYYDMGPRSGTTPVVLIPGTVGGPEQYHKVLMVLSSKGYRAIAVSFPVVFDYELWVAAMEAFLDTLRVPSAHMLGSGLGGFLVQILCALRPRRIISMVLCNSFLETRHFRESATFVDAVRLMPAFLLKRSLLKRFPQADTYSLDFMIQQVEAMKQPELASRIFINLSEYLGRERVAIDPHRVSIIDSLDDKSVPAEQRQKLYKRYEDGASIGQLKEGGPWPYLEVAEEFCVYLLVHLRRMEELTEASLKA